MGETTKLPASFSNGAVFESSTAFLMIQNKRRQTSNTDDVFRIFRRTGKKINEIANRIEGERNIYLKDSYNNKNTLYKELSGISNVKRGMHDTEKRKTARMKNHISALPRFSNVNSTSDLIYRPVKSQLGRSKQGEEVDFEPEKRMNVNVLKRCECCRRLAFMYKELNEKQQLEEDKKNESCDENTSSETQKITQEIIDSVRSTPAQITNDVDMARRRAKVLQFIQEMPGKKLSTSQVVPASFSSLRKQSRAKQGEGNGAEGGTPTTAPSSSERKPVRSRSYSILMKTSNTPRPEPTPSPLNRQKIRVKFENPNANEKVKIEGTAWNNHLRRLHGQDESDQIQNVFTLSKSYLAFKKLLRKMEEERKRQEELDNENRSNDSSGRNSPLFGRYEKRISLAALSRWQPKRNSKRTESIAPDIDLFSGSAPNLILEKTSDEDDNQSGTFTVLDCNT